MIVLSGLAFLLPVPLNWPSDETGFHQQLIVNLFMAGTHTGGAILFLANLDVYKTSLRRAYITLAIGTLITGAGTLQISLLTIFNAWDNPYGQSGATMLPFLLSGLVLYLAMRMFARLVGVRGSLVRAWIVVPGAVVLAVFSTILPHASAAATPEITYDLLVGISVWSASLMLFAGWLAAIVRRHAGGHYAPAMSWLMRALLFSAGVLLYQALYTSINVRYSMVLNTISNVVTVLSGIMWVRAGYAFALTKYYDHDISILRFLFHSSEQIEEAGPKTVIDMVTHAAGLASDEPEIDLLLDNVRAVTARLKPGQNPSPAETEMLVGIYLEIERYLVTKEPLRKFTTKELRAQLSPELRKLVASYKRS